MKKIRENFRGHYRELILGPTFKLFEAVLELFIPVLMASIIDVGIANGDGHYVVTRGLLMLALGVLGFGAAMICQYYAATSSGQIGRSLRNQAFAHVMRMTGDDVAAFDVGGLITRLTGDINQIQTGINMAIRLGSRAPFLAIGSIVMALRINAQIGLVFLVSTPLIVLILCLVMRATLPGYAGVQAGQDALSQQSAENLAGIRIIRAFGRQQTEKHVYDDLSGTLTGRMVRVGKISAMLNPLTSVIANLAIVVIVWLGAGYVFDGGMMPGEIIALVNYMTQMLLALTVAANLIVLFTRALASARRVSAVLMTTPTIKRREDAGPALPVPGAPLLRFEGVQFAYHKEAEKALADITFAIAHGETVGLTGGTGSGKSTVVNLMMRYYDADGGGVFMDGADIRALEPASLRGRIGLAPQKAVLFAGTIRHNLAIAAPGATDGEMWHALEVAQCDFVRRLAGGLDAMLLEGGQNLSGGQRQRLSIARALVRRPALLILDDAASALDYATDAALRAALRKEKQARPDMGILIVSQRVASIMHADRILVLDDGRLVGADAHERLVQGNAVYREICRSQGLLAEGVEG